MENKEGTEIKRYDISVGSIGLEECNDGTFVLYSDYTTLQSQLSEAKEERDNLAAELANSEKAHDITLQMLAEKNEEAIIDNFCDRFLAKLEEQGIKTDDCDGDTDPETIISDWIACKLENLSQEINDNKVKADKLATALGRFVSDFEGDFVLEDGTICDNPDERWFPMILIYKVQKLALSEYKGGENA